jgi:hypothetical protein
MKSSLIVSVALLVTALPFAAAAQTPSPSTGDLQIERKQKKAVVHPKQSPEQVRADADRAVDEYTGRTPGQVVRETSPVRPSSRPDLDYDVKHGIQQRNLNKELFKR